MTEFRFHHLERRRLEEALPDLLEKALEEGQRAVLQARSAEEVESLNERLWTYAEDSFLPHGSARDGDAADQPLYLTATDENPNGADLRVLLSGIDAAPFATPVYSRVLIVFDGKDEAELAETRRQWTAVKATGSPVSYWREADDGGWVKGR